MQPIARFFSLRGLSIGPGRALGVAVGEDRLHVAELRERRGKGLLRKAARFAFPTEDPWKDPEGLGKAFAAFLKAEGFSARRAVLGLPLKWVMAKAKTFPGAEEETLTAMLRLHAERVFAQESEQLSVDCVICEDEGPRFSVLFCAAVRERCEAVRRMAEAAGLVVDGITVSVAALALAERFEQGGGRGVVASLSSEAAEVAVRRGEGIERLFRMPLPAQQGSEASRARFVQELRRLVASLPGEEAQAESSFVLWDDGAPHDGKVAGIADAFPTGTVKEGDLGALFELDGALSRGGTTACVAEAAALARSVYERRIRAVDFLRSRLAPPRARRLTVPVRIGLAAAVALGAVVIVLGASYLSASSAVAELKAQLADQKELVGSAESFVRLVSEAEKWYGARPPYLACLLDLTRLFPEQETIWSTNLSMTEDSQCVLSGKATEYRSVLRLIENLGKSPRYSDVKLHGGISYPQSTAQQRYLSFSLRFRYKGGPRGD